MKSKLPVWYIKLYSAVSAKNVTEDLVIVSIGIGSHVDIGGLKVVRLN